MGTVALACLSPSSLPKSAGKLPISIFTLPGKDLVGKFLELQRSPIDYGESPQVATGGGWGGPIRYQSMPSNTSRLQSMTSKATLVSAMIRGCFPGVQDSLARGSASQYLNEGPPKAGR